MQKICFTGRRPNSLCGYKKENYAKFIPQLMHILTKYAESDAIWMTGGAQGFDQISFWTVDMLARQYAQYNMKNIVCVPFKGQERNWRKDGLFGQNEYKTMLDNADEVIYLNDILTDKYEIIKALYDRNHKMVDSSNLVIALYPDDSWTTAKGGTAECMRYAKSKNKTIIQLKYKINNNQLTISEDDVVLIA